MPSSMRAAYTQRIRLVAIAIVVIAILFVVRLYMLQVVDSATYEALADNQYVRPSHSIFDRGAIYLEDKDGTLIAGGATRSGYMLTINPTDIDDPEALYSELTKYVPLEREQFIERASKKDDPYEEVAHHIERAKVDEIRESDLTGVQLFREQWRYYPGDTLAAHVIGFVGYGQDGRELSGQYGLERYYDDVLMRTQKELNVNFFAELFGSVHDLVSADESVREADVVTSIEPNVQHFVEEELVQVHDEWRAKEIGAIVMDPRDGRIIALAALPTFNPNDRSDIDDASVFRNPLVSSVYEMGSIIKPIGMAIGLDAGVVTPEETYNDKGRVTVDGYTISNYDGRGRGVVSMQEVLNQSLNTGMAYVVSEVGNTEFGEGLRAFGIGEETGIDLPNEARGLVDNLDSPRDVEYVTAAFGQGIAMTPMATARALAALANGGKLVTPHVLHRYRHANGSIDEVSLPPDGQAVHAEAAEEITRMLVEVVDSSLRGGTVKKDRYSIAAKTGTAQIANVEERGYYDDRYLHSFFGYFPAYEPRFLVFLYHLEPQGARYASETLTAPFMNIADFLLHYYEIPPDR